ncbi:MAG: c-type cytochrome [Pseudomonadota bacterium]
MGELGLNKILGAGCATALAILGLQTLSAGVFGDGGHHGGHAPESIAEWAKKSFPGYYPDIVEEASDDDGEPEPVFDLGLALASADISRGETAFRACASCHSVEQGGGNGTGPNLYGLVGRDVGSVAGFNYSKALQDYEGAWSYEDLNGFLKAPKEYIPGTNMNVATSSDTRRTALIAYLASLDPSAPAYPDPLPAVVEEVVEDIVEEVTDAVVEDAPIEE